MLWLCQPIYMTSCQYTLELLLMCRWDTGIGSIAKLFGQLSIAGQYCELSRHFGIIAMLAHGKNTEVVLRIYWECYQKGKIR